MTETAVDWKEDVGLFLLRLALGGILLFHGIFKLTHGVEWIKQPLGTLGLPGFLAYGTYVAEVVAPLLLMLGLWARIAALVVAFDMLMAIALVLRPRIFTINEMGGGWGFGPKMAMVPIRTPQSAVSAAADKKIMRN